MREKATNPANCPTVKLARALWNWEPHPTQRKWLECNAKTKVAACGRRWGKTEAAAVDAAAMAILAPGSRQMIVSPTYDQSRLIFDTVERLMLASSRIRNLVKVVRTPYPKLTLLGSTITARTADEDGRNLRGHSADRVIVDEAAFVRDSVIQEVISPMLADRDGQLVMLSTPFGKNHFYKAFLRGREVESHSGEHSRRFASFSFPSACNPHISAQYIEQQRQYLSPRQFSVEYEAQFIDDCACIFSWDEIERAAGQSETSGQFSLAKYDCVVAGIDWARYSDYTAMVALGISGSDFEVIGLQRMNGSSWSLQIERAVDFIRQNRAISVLTDSTSIGDPLLEQLRSRAWANGLDASIEGYTFSNSSKRELIDNLALLFASGSISIPANEQLIRELQYFEYELTQSGNVRMNARAGYSDDLVIALALACWQARSAPGSEGVLSRNGRIAVGEW